jgi:hypothetical protein
MPSGDPQRTWFPEMIEMLRTECDAAFSFPELVALTDRLDGTLQRIRAERGIVPPMMWCPHCRKRVRSARPRVSVRAAILALGRFGIADRGTVKTLEKKWKQYQREKGLDNYGHTAATGRESARLTKALGSRRVPRRAFGGRRRGAGDAWSERRGSGAGDYLGIDFSPDLLAIARKHWPKRNLVNFNWRGTVSLNLVGWQTGAAAITRRPLAASSGRAVGTAIGSVTPGRWSLLPVASSPCRLHESQTDDWELAANRRERYPAFRHSCGVLRERGNVCR